ncbi:MBL fold metallo-hydrolase [Ferrimonas marina]|uniref:MBL fold metallo-hydrolase n=1 Tax=Ferrimonas marina TaxID=299255 RepID=UPI0008365290|nr:MBL fold metallo-hydrolase [Ferrimonas marina]
MKLTSMFFAAAMLPATLWAAPAPSQQCPDKGAYVQVLGAGGPELTTGLASTSYLIWQDGKARVLIDAGAGTAMNFKQAGAQMADLDAILISHMHVDHVADLISLLKASYFDGREVPLPIYGPTGNQLTPGMTDYMQRLLGLEGLYPYLNNFLAEAPDPSFSKASYRWVPRDIQPSETPTSFALGDLRFASADAKHGGVPALAWSVTLEDKTLFVTGDSSGPGYLKAMADEADIIIAHNALPQSYSGPVERLHMKPDAIATIVGQSKASTLVLSHFLDRTATSSVQQETQVVLAASFKDEIAFAQDFDCYPL